MPDDTCTVSGVLRTPDWGYAPAGTPLTIKKAVKNGAVIFTGPLYEQTVYVSGDVGEISFTVPRAAQVWLFAQGYAGATLLEKSGGMEFDIPDEDTATLESLGASAAVPSQGITIQDNGSSLFGLYNTFNIVGATVERVSSGVARLTLTSPGLSATFITQTPSGSLANEQALSALATGILKNTTATGVLSIATGSDLPSSIPLTKLSITGTPDGSKFLRDDGSWQAVNAGVSSFNGRTGAITPTQDDYTFAQLASKPTTLSGYSISDAQGLNVTLTAVAAHNAVNSFSTDVVGFGFGLSTNLDGLLNLEITMDDAAAFRGAIGAQPSSANLTTFAAIAPSANVITLLGSANYAAFKTSLSLGNVENTALSTWAGSTNLTTLGTVGSGVWQGSAIADAYISSAATWNAKQDALGFTAENVANKATGFGTLNNTLYPTTQAVANYAQPLDAELNALAGLTSAADRLAYFTGSGTASLAVFTSYGRSLMAVADEAAFKALVNLEIGVDVQAFSSNLSTFATIAPSANVQTLLGSADYSAFRTSLGVVIGSNVQAWSAVLDDLGGLTQAANKLPYFDSSSTAAVTDLSAFGRSLIDDADASAGRSTLGLGSIATQSAAAIAITGGSIAGLTAFGVRSSGSGAFDLSLANTENLSAGRTLTVTLNDASRTLTIAGNATISNTNTGDQSSVTGNAGTATALQTARNINGVAFDGTASITVPAAAGTLTGATLASNVLASSLTSLGTIATGVWQGTVIAPTYGGTGIDSSGSTGLAKVAAGTWSVASLVNADVSNSAAIVYSKLNLTGAILNADINASAAIAYSKLNLSASIVNADIASVAAIVDTKLATIATAGKVSDSALSSNIVLKNAANAWSIGAQDFSAATSLKIPTGASLAPTANGFLGYDSSANAYKFGVNGTSKTVLFTDGSGANLTSLNFANMTSSTLEFDRSARYVMRQLQSKFAKIRNGTAINAVITIIGDSITNNQSYTPYLRTDLGAQFGEGGIGYVRFDSGQGSEGAGTSVTTGGTWTEVLQSSSSLGAHCGHVSTTDPAATKSVSGSGTLASSIVVQYVKQPSGGSFRYRVDGGSWTTQATANASVTVDSITISGLDPMATHDLDIDIDSIGSGVAMVAADFRKASGVRINNLGNTGSMASQFASQNATAWQASLAATSPDLVVLEWGQNEVSNGQSAATYAASLSTLITRIQAAVPLADILVIGPYANGTNDITAHNVAAHNLARTAGVGWLDWYKIIDAWANANSRGLMSDAAHVSGDGGRVIADLMFSYLNDAIGAYLQGGKYTSSISLSYYNGTTGSKVSALKSDNATEAGYLGNFGNDLVLRVTGGDGLSFNLPNGTTAVRMLASGLVAFGTPSPFARVHVVSTDVALPALYLQGLTGQTGAELLITDDSRIPQSAIFNNRFSLYNLSEADTYDTPTNYERLRISPVANVFTIASEAGGTGTLRNLTLAAPNILLSGVVKAGSGPTTLTDSAGKILSAALNTVAVDKGGTGQTSYTDGQILIGNSTGNTLAKSTLTSGSGILITNGSGAITIATTGERLLATATGIATDDDSAAQNLYTVPSGKKALITRIIITSSTQDVSDAVYQVGYDGGASDVAISINGPSTTTYSNYLLDIGIAQPPAIGNATDVLKFIASTLPGATHGTATVLVFGYEY